MDKSIEPMRARSIESSAGKKRSNAIWGAFLSEFIDMFDIYLPTVVLTPVLFLFKPSNMSSELRSTVASLIFITTLLGRPLGAVLFGAIADRVGRKAASLWSVSGFAVITLLIALLPDYGTIGAASYWLLILLRFADGICLGGGYTGAIPLAMEYARKEQRGLVGALIFAAFPAAYVAIALVGTAMFALFPLDGPHSPYAAIGWRIPFAIGSALAGLLALYYYFKVSESEIWAGGLKQKGTKVPLTDLLTGRSGVQLIQVLLMLTGFWLTQNLITIYVPTRLLPAVLHLTKYRASSILLISYTTLIGSYLLAGIVAQKLGRRRFFLIAGPAIAIIGGPVLLVLSQANEMSFSMIAFLVTVLSIVVTSPWGVIATYINERFLTDVRATGFGLGYSLSVVIPSFYAFYLAWLSEVIPSAYCPAVLLVVGSLVATLGAALGPETKNVDFA